VSGSLKELEHWRAVRVVSLRGSRTTHYQAEDQLLRTVAAILAKRELEAVRRLRDAAAEVRMAYSPARHGKRLTGRLTAVEHCCDLYEVLAGSIGTMARLPIGIAEQAARAVKVSKLLERTARRVRLRR